MIILTDNYTGALTLGITSDEYVYVPYTNKDWYTGVVLYSEILNKKVIMYNHPKVVSKLEKNKVHYLFVGKIEGEHMKDFKARIERTYEENKEWIDNYENGNQFFFGIARDAGVAPNAHTINKFSITRSLNEDDNSYFIYIDLDKDITPVQEYQTLKFYQDMFINWYYKVLPTTPYGEEEINKSYSPDLDSLYDGTNLMSGNSIEELLLKMEFIVRIAKHKMLNYINK